MRLRRRMAYLLMPDISYGCMFLCYVYVTGESPYPRGPIYKCFVFVLVLGPQVLVLDLQPSLSP